MLKLLTLVLGLFVLAPAERVQAAQDTLEIGYSTGAPTGVQCTSGTVVTVNLSTPTGFGEYRSAGYRIQNQGDEAVWLGASVDVSTLPASGTAPETLGERLNAGASAPYSLGYLMGRTNNGTLVQLSCLAADAAGAGGVPLSVQWFGY